MMIGFEPTDRPDEVLDGPVRALLVEVNGRAAGLWRVEGDRLRQLTFLPAPDLPPEVAAAFVEATRTVPLSASDLGIVGAVLAGEPRVSVAGELPADAGSGYWLRAFGAERSIAVPLKGRDGRVVAVLSVAVPSGAPDDAAIAERARVRAASLERPDEARG